MKQTKKTETQTLSILYKTLESWERSEPVLVGTAQERLRDQIYAMRWAISKLDKSFKDKGDLFNE